jgi:hypothetical protein
MVCKYVCKPRTFLSTYVNMYVHQERSQVHTYTKNVLKYICKYGCTPRTFFSTYVCTYVHQEHS